MYVDGFVAAVPTANKQAYRQHAETAFIFLQHLLLSSRWSDENLQTF